MKSLSSSPLEAPVLPAEIDKILNQQEVKIHLLNLLHLSIEEQGWYLGSRDGTVVRALSSNQSGLGSIVTQVATIYSDTKEKRMQKNEKN